LNLIDLRSDTITRPTENMRRAMATAEVGDDVFGEDPTVKRLEEMAAERLDKQAALFVASGTMANLTCQMVHCGRGDEMLVGDQAHIFFYEQGGSAAIGGIHPRSLVNQPDGTIALNDIESAVRPDNVHYPRTRLLVLENTHNRCCGMPLGVDYMRSVKALADRCHLKVHVDGARIFNAAIALNTTPGELTQGADSVSMCLSKGLAAPVGSLVCGNSEFIAQARRVRKVLGGGMRQVGVLAAAGIVALTEMVERLAEDHANAGELARRLSEIPGLTVPLELVRTNIVYARIAKDRMSAAQLVAALGEKGVRVLPTAADKIRAVTNYHISRKDVITAADAFAKVMSA
jgi:threonine aldolase